MAKYVVAVSGGVDSVALLHMLTAQKEHDIIVAHFDHGIRTDSALDAQFVADLAAQYGHSFTTSRVELGEAASEDQARQARYAFLRSVAKTNDAALVTAHHADDVIETIAINVHRGTGWRGLAVMDSSIYRPLLDTSKQDLVAYAAQHQLQWREDSTNASDNYLRNRLRKKTRLLDDDKKRQLWALRSQQVDTKHQIDSEVAALVGEGPEYSRYFFSHIPTAVALECLRYITKGQLTRPQLRKVLLAIKTAKPKSSLTAGSGVTIDFTTRNFSLSLLK